MKKNVMIEPEYIDGQGFSKFDVKTPCLVFGCGNLVHENLFLNFLNPTDVVLYDPDPFGCLRDTIDMGGFSAQIFKSWDTVIEQSIKYKTIICFFSLHFIPNWLDQLWELHNMLDIGGNLFIAEDRGFRALLDFNYLPSKDSELINTETIKIVCDKFIQRKENGFPWYPDISAGNMTQVREILAPYYKLEQKEDYNLKRVYVQGEIENYLPWMKKFWNLDESYYPDLKFLDKVNEIVTVYKLTKEENALPPLWDLTNDEFINNIWAIKMMHCHRALVRNSPRYANDEEFLNNEDWINDQLTNDEMKPVRQLFFSYIIIIYQHLLRHLPGGLAEFVSLDPQNYYYGFTTPQKDYFKNLPHVAWTSNVYGLSNETPSWYTKYIRQLDDEQLRWAGENFLYENTGAFTYMLKENDWPKYSSLDRYYCSPIYEEVFENIGYEIKMPEKLNEREVNPFIYATVQAAKTKRLPNGNADNSTSPYKNRHELKYVGFVLYLPSRDISITEKLKYGVICSLISHLLVYVQAQMTAYLAITALDVLLPLTIKDKYRGFNPRDLDTAYNEIFMQDSAHKIFKQQHDMVDISAEKTLYNYRRMIPRYQGAVSKYLDNCNFANIDFMQTNFTCKWLKAIIGRSKETIYLLDFYLSLKYDEVKNNSEDFKSVLEATEQYINTFKNSDKNSGWRPIKIDGCLYASWYIFNWITRLKNLEENHQSVKIEKILLLENALLIITDNKIFPDGFIKNIHAGSLGQYVNWARSTHLKLFKTEHKFLHLASPKSLESFNEKELKILLDYISPPHGYEDKMIFQMAHVYIVFKESGRNALLLRNYIPSSVDASID